MSTELERATDALHDLHAHFAGFPPGVRGGRALREHLHAGHGLHVPERPIGWTRRELNGLHDMGHAEEIEVVLLNLDAALDACARQLASVPA